MGSLLSKFYPTSTPTTRKRKRIADPNEDVPVVKRFRSTTEYVYSELFGKGLGSDLTVVALGREWPLHRIYLKQSPFFAAMLEGGWKESESARVELELTDTNITIPALQTVFGSYYYDKVIVTKETVVSILATATWFHLDDVREVCSDFMQRSLDISNVTQYFAIAEQYNVCKLKSASLRWLLRHLFTQKDSQELYDLLRRISPVLMKSIIENPHLVVVTMEHDVFLLLLKWVYLQLHPDVYYAPGDNLLKKAYTFQLSTDPRFLESEAGEVYAPVFNAVRWDYILCQHKSTYRLVRDRVVPESWLTTAISRQWIRSVYVHASHTQYIRSEHPDIETTTASNNNPLLYSSNNLSNSSATVPLANVLAPGPRVDLPEEVFWATSDRCGRIINNAETNISWRWSGYHFGLDIVMKYSQRLFTVIRLTQANTSEGAVTHGAVHRLMISLRILSLVSSNDEDTGSNSSDVCNHTSSQEASTDVLRLALEENEACHILKLPDEFDFPVVLSANILRFEPIDVTSLADNVSKTHSQETTEQ